MDPCFSCIWGKCILNFWYRVIHAILPPTDVHTHPKAFMEAPVYIFVPIFCWRIECKMLLVYEKIHSNTALQKCMSNWRIRLPQNTDLHVSKNILFIYFTAFLTILCYTSAIMNILFEHRICFPRRVLLTIINHIFCTEISAQYLQSEFFKYEICLLSHLSKLIQDNFEFHYIMSTKENFFYIQAR